MYLEKFPVTTDKGEYLISIVESYVCLGMYQWRVYIYKKIKRRFLSGYKDKHVYKYDTGWRNYNAWNGKFVELSKQAVISYEDKINKETEKEKMRKKGVIEFENWDGKVS